MIMIWEIKEVKDWLSYYIKILNQKTCISELKKVVDITRMKVKFQEKV